MSRTSELAPATGVNPQATKIAHFLAEAMLAHLRGTHVSRVGGINATFSFRLRYVLLDTQEQLGNKHKRRYPQLPSFECPSSSASLLFALKETERECKLLRSFHGGGGRKALAVNANSKLNVLRAIVQNQTSHNDSVA